MATMTRTPQTPARLTTSSTVCWAALLALLLDLAALMTGVASDKQTQSSACQASWRPRVRKPEAGSATKEQPGNATAMMIQLRTASWNVDGLSRHELDVIVDHVSGHAEWDVLM